MRGIGRSRPFGAYSYSVRSLRYAIGLVRTSVLSTNWSTYPAANPIERTSGSAIAPPMAEAKRSAWITRYGRS